MRFARLRALWWIIRNWETFHSFVMKTARCPECVPAGDYYCDEHTPELIALQDEFYGDDDGSPKN